MENFNKKNLVELRKEGGITEEVVNYTLENWEDYEIKENILKDVIDNGCQSGIVSELIYFSDTLKFYDRHKEEINELLVYIMEESGIQNISELLKDFDTSDPLALQVHNQNLLAWFGFEMISLFIYNKLS